MATRTLQWGESGLIEAPAATTAFPAFHPAAAIGQFGEYRQKPLGLSGSAMSEEHITSEGVGVKMKRDGRLSKTISFPRLHFANASAWLNQIEYGRHS
jgi:hypothetical protein